MHISYKVDIGAVLLIIVADPIISQSEADGRKLLKVLSRGLTAKWNTTFSSTNPGGIRVKIAFQVLRIKLFVILWAARTDASAVQGRRRVREPATPSDVFRIQYSAHRMEKTGHSV
ncbi:hypothetical protein EVAR_67403_1 [Eumeta japonica]|uniref:Uncharacterized protein n=1 Tax=Eumeta variegata TaxID=151549 RepID=A0A4C1ZW29_EUMVA|nr:hypothetical protein EVAR_67403_1 [Eumeta japonica]